MNLDCEYCGNKDAQKYETGRFCNVDCNIAAVFGLSDEKFKKMKEAQK